MFLDMYHVSTMLVPCCTLKYIGVQCKYYDIMVGYMKMAIIYHNMLLTTVHVCIRVLKNRF